MNWAGWVSAGRVAAIAGIVMATGACSSIVYHRGYIAEPVLTNAIHPGIDNKRSVRGTLGDPTLVSQFGNPVWYYVSSVTHQAPFTRPHITSESVLAIHFNRAGDVTAVDHTGLSKVVQVKPDHAKTPTLGRKRTLLEDLFGNIGQVGAAAPGVGGAGGGPGGGGAGGG